MSKKNYAILHISDLHRSPTDPISNEELVSALVSDYERYTKEPTPVPSPDAIIVSGDIIQGVPRGTTDFRAELDKQYAVAAAFLDDLARRFVEGDRSRVVIVPGNHDVDWNTSFQAMTEVADDDIPKGLGAKLSSETSDLRWDWEARRLYRISDRALYENRLEAFWTFFDKFYEGVPGLLRVKAGSDANLFELANGKIAVAAFNSCFGNDCFAYHGMIRKEAIAQSYLDLNDLGGLYDLRIAVWHHNIEGPPYRSDYMDVDLVRGMIGRGYRLGLYGHHHKSQIAAHQIFLPDQEQMVVVSAGSLCAGRNELPTGTCRQYNVIEIGPDFQSVNVHVRTMEVANLFLPARLLDFGGRTYASLRWDKPVNLAGKPIDPSRERLQIAVEAAEQALMSGDPIGAIALLRQFPLASGTYERRLMVEAALKSEDWSLLSMIADPPETMEELVAAIEAHCNLGKPEAANELLDQHAERLELPSSIAADLRLRIRARKEIGR